jgi:magnesium transporter
VPGAHWIDLLDPTRDELLRALPPLDPGVLDELDAPAATGLALRPLLESHGSYLFGILVAAHPLPDEDRVVYQEIDLVATPALLVTVRKTPADGPPYVCAELPPAVERGGDAGTLTHQLVDGIAESYLEAVDSTYDEISELEDNIERWESSRVRQRLSSVRRDVLYLRRTVAATRGWVRRVVDGRLDVGDHALFPEDVERLFADTYDTLVRGTEELDVARDLLASARDYHQATISERQNDVVKKLAVIASLLLLPALIVGFYGQNFAGVFGRPYWSLGVSTALIAASTAAQLVVFKWRRWI